MKNTAKCAGIAAATFGCGILLAFFLPEPVLVVIEAAVIVVAGVLFIKS
ncbi:MAG: hypothetical protein PUB08_07215 [Firmicutes bacterium]|nr:hypothetical protein [Bacillota bacterium]